MKQKTLLLFFLLLSTVMANAQTLIDGIYYDLNTYSNQATVISGDTPYTGQVVIPETIKHEDVTYDVTSVGNRAFKDCSGLTSITIPSSVSYVGQRAFEGCIDLTSVILPNGVTSIEDGTFYGCSSLTGIEIPNSVRTIYSEAFYNCSGLTSIIIPNSVTSIESSAFSGCSGLTSVIIPDNVTTIGQSTFFNCSNLASVTIPNSVTSIGRYAFYGTEWYNNQPDGLVYAGNIVYAYKGTMPQNTSISIKEGTSSITGYAFYKCSGLTSVIIPNSVKAIGSYAFASCSELIDVYCYARKGPAANDGIFNNSGIQFAMLHVPEISINGYNTTTPWSGFGNIVALQDSDPKPESEPEPTPEPTPEYIRGDVNGDGVVNGTDIQEVINIIVNGDDEDEDNKFEKAGVRFGFYETIPGYSVKINKINITGLGVAEIGSDIIGSTIGTSTDTRILDRADGNFTNVDLKDINEDTEMVVEVDFTMIADDGSGETINQKATTTVAPQGVTQWQPNRNYTFIYKILLTPLYMIEDSVPAICFDSVVVDGQGGMTR